MVTRSNSEIWKELDRLKAENEKLAREATARVKRTEFWDKWLTSMEPPINLLVQVTAVTNRVNHFAWYDQNQDVRDQFWDDLLNRCIKAYPEFDETESQFTTWVCKNATSIADQIIKSSLSVPKRGALGIGLRWPYNDVHERTFTDLEPDDPDFDWDCFGFLATEKENEFKTEVQNWISAQMNGDEDIARICDAVWRHSQNWPPGPVAISRATELPTDVVKEKLNTMKERYEVRFGNKRV